DLKLLKNGMLVFSSCKKILDKKNYLLTRETKPKPKRPVAYSGKTAQQIFNEIKNSQGEVTNEEILNYMRKNRSTLRFKDEKK
ncbi:3064_t:CDS:1, partial [Gigaspora margarita]